ncbi:MAG: serine hydrolase [Myxococcales bacterium]|nr:serine hydrolase [Myxococcales bacterium]
MSRIARTIATCFLGLAPWLPAPAAAGAIAVAYPIDGLTIDGDLSDWGSDHVPVAVDWTDAEQPPSEDDLSARFRVAYDTGHLYVALDVHDDVHVPSPGAAADWTTQDTHLLYVDREHLPRGSGAVLLELADGFDGIIAPRAAWDPANAGGSLPGLESAMRRHEMSTTYEWRIPLGEYIRANRTVGLDHLVLDRDSATEDDGEAVLWSDGYGKSQHSYRLGDVMLLEADAALGEVAGTLEWAAPSDDPLPAHVRLTSLAHPELWVSTDVDEQGRFSATLPQGRYRITSAYTLTEPFLQDVGVLPRRIDPYSRVEVTVMQRQQARPTLALRTFERPDYLFGEHGLLLDDWGPVKEQALDGFVDAFRRYYDVPGVSVAVVHGGELVYHRTFGVKNTLTQAPVQTDTLFEAASITKPAFAFAVMRLVERGVLKLDRPLRRDLVFPNIERDRRSRKLTARHVLSHRSGLPNWAWGGPGGWRQGDELQLLARPGTTFGYSGEAFDYLGRVVEQATGLGLAEVLQREVAEPMGMTNSPYALSNDQADDASVGHFHAFPVWKRRATEVSPASSMHTSARDFARLMRGWMQRRGLSESSYDEMWRTHTPISAEDRVHDDDWPQSVGLGFFLREAPFGQIVEHGGNNGDFRCKFAIVPEAGFGYAVFTNNNVGDELAHALELFLLQGRSAL